MSITSPITKNYSKDKFQVSSNLVKMSEHLTDSNILQSRKTYGRKKDVRSSSISSESSGSFSATSAENLKNNRILSFTDYNELYSEKKFKCVTNNYSENSTIQKSTVVESKLSLYTEEDMEYLYSERQDDSSPSIPEISSSGSNYQRTRKNQKNRLSNQQYRSEEVFESMLHTNNFNSFTNANESKSASNLNPKQMPAEQNSSLSTDNQLKHTKNNVIKSTNACVNNLPQKQNLFQAGNIFEKRTVSHNPLNKMKFLPILDLVNRFAASRNQDNAKSDPKTKRKRKKEGESIPAKKRVTVTKNGASSKKNSVENKITNPATSVKTYSKNTILKSDMISTVNYVGTIKEGDVKTSPKVIQKKYSISVDNAKRTVDMVDIVNNSSTFRKSDFKTPSKSAQKKKCRSVDNAEKSVGMIGSVNNASAHRKNDAKTPSKAMQKKNCISVDNTEKSIEILKKFVSKNTKVKNYATAKFKRPSSSADLHLIKNGTIEKIQSDNGDKQVEKPPLMQTKESMFQNQTLTIMPNGNVKEFSFPMPIIIAPMAPTSLEGAFQVAPLAMWRTVPSITNNHLIQSDNNAVSHENFGDLSVSGPSSLSNDHSNINGSGSSLNNLGKSESIYLITKDTTTIINESYQKSNEQKCSFRPRTLINDGIEFQRYVDNNFKYIEGNCILHCKEQSSKTFLKNPDLLNVTVKHFCSNYAVTDFLLDYLSGFDIGKSLALHDTNKGYDFPENFETENLLRVVKDFVHTTISYMIPVNTLKSLNISYSLIMKCAMQKMSSREFLIMNRVFRRSEKFKLKDVLARLSLVALFVIFDEYKSRKRREVL